MEMRQAGVMSKSVTLTVKKQVVISELDKWWGFQVILKLPADFTLLGSEFHRVGAMKTNT